MPERGTAGSYGIRSRQRLNRRSVGSLPVFFFFWHVWPLSLQEVSAGVGGCDKATSRGERGYKGDDLCDPLEMEADNNEVCQRVLLQFGMRLSY